MTDPNVEIVSWHDRRVYDSEYPLVLEWYMPESMFEDADSNFYVLGGDEQEAAFPERGRHQDSDVGVLLERGEE